MYKLTYTALPIFRDFVFRAYKEGIIGEAPRFPREIEAGIDEYLLVQAALAATPAPPPPPPATDS